MKICQLCNVGFALKIFLLPLIDAQLENGDEVIALCADDEHVDEVRQRGYVVQTLPISRSLNPIKHIYSIWVIFLFFRKEKFDIVHVHTPVAALLGRIAARLCKVKFVVYTAHGFYFHDDMKPIKRLFFIKLEKFAGKMTNLIFTQSKEDAALAVREGFINSSRVFDIGNGVDVNLFNPDNILVNGQIRDELGISKNAFLVGMIGRQVVEKGIVELMEAARDLVEKYNDVYFIIIGDRLPSDHAGSVDNIIKKTKLLLNNKLIISGMRSNIPELLASMNLFVLPSWREGMPRTIIEAMMMKLPVVATNIRGSREEVIDKVTGLLVPLRNSHALSKAIESLYLDRKKCIEMGIAGRERALELYNEKNVINKQILLINQFYK